MKYLYFLRKQLILIIFFISFFIGQKKKRIGVIGLNHGLNIGNNLLKYAMHIKLTELGFKPYFIGTNYKHNDISFLKNFTNCRIIKNNFTEVSKKDYDILMVNSDQTWRKFDKHFYDIGFLKFSYNWRMPKFVYGASFGFNKWNINKKDEDVIKKSLSFKYGV